MASTRMEDKAGLARPLQDVEKQLRATMPELLSAIYLVGRHAGEVRRREMEGMLAAHPEVPYRTGSDTKRDGAISEGEKIDWNRMGHYLKMIMGKVEGAQANVETLRNVLGNKYVKKVLEDPRALWRLAKKKEKKADKKKEKKGKKKMREELQ